jgi:hypothetical protein
MINKINKLGYYFFAKIKTKTRYSNLSRKKLSTANTPFITNALRKLPNELFPLIPFCISKKCGKLSYFRLKINVLLSPGACRF